MYKHYGTVQITSRRGLNPLLGWYAISASTLYVFKHINIE